MAAKTTSPGVTDGLELLKRLRASGTPQGVWELGLPVLHGNPLATAADVFAALEVAHADGEGPVQAATLRKAQCLMETGELPIPAALVDPLDEIAELRGDKVG